jgi:hypothetical protein
MTPKILDSSANSKIADKIIHAHKSLIKILNNRGHKVESCGTPGSLGKGKENIRTLQTL